MNAELLETVNKIELLIQLGFGILSFILSIYFSARFGRLSVFSPNLKIILILTNICGSFVTMLHPLLSFLSPESYSVNNESSIPMAILFYGSNFLFRITIYLFGFKNFIITAERRFAFIHRRDYEQRGCKLAVVWLSAFMATVAVFILFRIIYRIHSSVHSDINETLEDAFLYERSLFDNLCYYVICGISFAVSGVDMCLLSRKAKDERNRGVSLTESFQLKQTIDVMNVIRPLYNAFLICMLFCSVVFCLQLYDLFFYHRSYNSVLYIACLNFQYMAGSIYIFYSAGYMCWRFESMRNAVADDIYRLFGIRMAKSPQITTINVAHTERHFQMLESSWR